MDKTCQECNEKIELLPEQEPTPSTTSTGTSMTSSITTTETFTFYTGIQFPPTTKIYKCSNPKCWVTKITESWK